MFVTSHSVAVVMILLSEDHVYHPSFTGNGLPDPEGQNSDGPPQSYCVANQLPAGAKYPADEFAVHFSL